MNHNFCKRALAEALSSLTGVASGQILSAITTAPAEMEGDFSLPCFEFARVLKKNPKIIAEELSARITLPPQFTHVVPVNGYLNFSLDPIRFAEETLTAIQKERKRYGHGDSGRERTVLIDFSSPNMGKELAFHHLRGTMLGNALSRIYAACGYRVIRINYLGDWGTSYGKLIVMFKNQNLPDDDGALSAMSNEQLNGLYQSFAKAVKENAGLEKAARAAFKKLEAGDAELERLWKAFREITLKELKVLYDELNVKFDHFTGESFFVKQAGATIQTLKEKGLWRESRGSQVVDLSTIGLPPFMLRKSDGSTLYATRDLCAAIYRQNTYQFHKSLYVVDMGQSLHFRQLFKVLELMGYSWHKNCRHVAFGLVLTRGKNGKWERGKTRAGGVSLLKDVIRKAADKILLIIKEKNPYLKNPEATARKIAIGALTFNDFKHRRSNDINFDWNAVLSFEGDTGPYVINAYVRLCSILRKHAQRSGVNPGQFIREAVPDFSNLQEPETRQLITVLSMFPEKVTAVLEKDDPYILGQYALTLADRAHSFIHACRVIGSKEETERLFLSDCTRLVLKNTLSLLGIPLVEEM